MKTKVILNQKWNEGVTKAAALRYVLCALLLLPLTAGGRMTAQSGSFDWQGNPTGSPYVTAPSAGTIMPSAAQSSYSPTIYEVGTNDLPSDAYDPTTEGKERANKPGIKKDFITGPETGQSNEYPIGEPWVLAFFAVVAGGVIAFRRKRLKLND